MWLMVDERDGPQSSADLDRSEGFGERLLGSLLDRAHRMPPHMIAPLIEQEIALIGGRDVEVLLQDYDQMTLVPLPGARLLMDPPRPIDGSLAGRAFQTDLTIEQTQDDGVRLFVPLLDGTDRVGVLVFTLDTVDEHDRRLARRLAGLVADMLITKSMYTDRFFQARRRQPMSLSAEMQWQLLPPLMMTTPQVAIAGALEPAYNVAGDSFRLRPQRQHPSSGHDRRNGPRARRRTNGNPRHRRTSARPTSQRRAGWSLRGHGWSDHQPVRC